VTLPAETDIVRRTHRCMGTVASVHVHDVAPLPHVEAAIAEVFVRLDRDEAMFSTFLPDSEISRIGRGELHLLDASHEVIDVLDACTWLEHVSEGAFRARRPEDTTAIDPAAFVKGWSTRRASLALAEAGLVDWIVSVGGDLQTSGSPITGERWDIALTDPSRPGEALCSVSIAAGAVATSGTAQRGDHLWDGRCDMPPDDLVALTVVGPDLTWADAFATAGFALGIDGVAWVARFDGYHALAVTSDGLVLTDPGFAISAARHP
jgi:thiamine biosynthesis lipoprotein